MRSMLAIPPPRPIDIFDQIPDLCNGPIQLIVLPPPQVKEAIHRYYLTTDTSQLEHVEESDLQGLSNSDVLSLQEGGESGKIVELVDRLFTHAINIGASDIHIEPCKHLASITVIWGVWWLRIGAV